MATIGREGCTAVQAVLGAVGEEHMVERTIGVHEDLPAIAAHVFKLRLKLPEIGGWQGE